jgi:2-keto-3-deoxy-L-rhamnonate aldolase RhmA
MKINSLKEKLRQKEITIGSWLTLGDPAIAEIMAKSGFDWLVVDMEHSALSINQVQELIRIVDLSGCVPLVRVMDNNPEIIKKCMDMGSHGVIVPRVNTKSDAEKIVNAVNYPPQGTRGVGLFRAQNYSLDLKSYQKWNDQESIVIVQIEHIEAIENLSSIMDVDGIDGLIVGPYDLSASLGYPGEFEHPLVKEAFQTIQSTINKSSTSWGFHVVDPDPNIVMDKINEGYRFIAFGVDFLFFSSTCNKKLSLLKKLIAKQKQ